MAINEAATPQTDGSALIWRRRGTFVLAAAGSAIGLGNIWRFPHELGTNGGSAFLFVYLLCIAGICVPLMVAEALIGRVGRTGAVYSFTAIANRQGTGELWVAVGAIGILTGFLIASFYAVVGGWTAAYTLDSLLFHSVSGEAESSAFFDQLTSLWAVPFAELGFWEIVQKMKVGVLSILMLSLFLVLSSAVVYRGVLKGLEKFVQLVMPLLFLLVVVMVVYSLAVGNTVEALRFIFTPDFSRLSPEVALKAMGHAFFSLSLGMGVFITYGGYTPKEQSLSKAIGTVALLDTLVAVLAGLMIFPLVFASEGIVADVGPSLVFISMPQAFSQMPLGNIVQPMFFLLLLVAAISSMVSLMEPMVATVERRFGINRHSACKTVVGIMWVLALGCAFSQDMFSILDYVTANIMLPLGGILVAIYVGWVLKPSLYADQAGMPAGSMRLIWLWIVRLFAPIAIVAILINGVFFS